MYQSHYRLKRLLPLRLGSHTAVECHKINYRSNTFYHELQQFGKVVIGCAANHHISELWQLVIKRVQFCQTIIGCVAYYRSM